jgi:hypothetical protein
VPAPTVEAAETATRARASSPLGRLDTGERIRAVVIVALLAFLLTGQYMDFHEPKMDVLDAGMRMMFRSRHIYILFAGLLNLAVGAYFVTRDAGWRRGAQRVGSALIILGALLSLVAFVYEPPSVGLQQSFTLPAVVALAIGTLCHVAASKKGPAS